MKDDYIRMLEENFPEHAESLLNSLKIPPEKSIRVNTLKIHLEKALTLVPCEYERVPWYNEALILRNVKGVGNWPQVKQGLFYLQDLSSMVPPLILNPKPGEKILDFCAAPGSKTTQLAQISRNKAEIHAFDISEGRKNALRYNLRITGSKVRIIDSVNEQYDKILVDAPCSGDGAAKKDPELMKKWSLKKSKRFSLIQRKLLNKAANHANEIIYSTCSLTKQENEFVLEKFLNKHDFELVPWELKGFNHHGNRIFPFENNSIGFFVSKLRKRF